MKRMTTRVYGKSSLVKGMSIFDIKEAVDRLAAYEDTGLEPKEIDEVFDEYNDVLKAIIKDGERMITNDRLRELAEADREGRCMIVPVKSGQSVYCLQDYFNETTLKSEKRVKCRTVDFVLAGAKMFETEGFIWRFSEIGEKIFLTREEAEAALAKLNLGT